MLVEVNMMVIGIKEKKMEKVLSIIMMAGCMMVNGRMIKEMEKEL